MIKKLIACAAMITVFCAGGQISEISNNNWILDTETMSYRISVSGGQLRAHYYGPRLSEHDRTGGGAYTASGWEVPVRGNTVWGTPSLEAVFADGVRDIELEFVSAETESRGGYELLRVVQKDNHYPLQVTTCYRVLPEYDIIEKWSEVEHTGTKRDKAILIENLKSGTLWLPAGDYELMHLSGTLRNEFQPQHTVITYGVKSVQAVDFKSYGAPYFAIRPGGERSETHGEVWYGQLHYSGNWAIDVEKLGNGTVQVTGGIRFWDSAVNLAPGESFTSPVFSFGYTRRGYEGVAQNYSAYVSKELTPAATQGKVRPVIYNSWYATEFDVNEEQQLALAKVAREIGVELFVIDDGWFKGRINDQGGLGDWTVDLDKFPNGLTPLIKQINDMGMDFGIWVEPEMVNPNSDLFRAHPDWIFHYPNRRKTLGRGQHLLNLGREDVYRYLHKSLSDLLRDHNIKFLKWDMNRHLSEPGWPSAEPAKQREARIRHIENLYRLIEALKEEFPHVIFETCSSGGGRVDLGMLSRMDVSWASDNIDPLDRIYIQYAYQYAFPANTMVSWTGQEDWHNGNYPLGFRFDVAMNGVLGIGNDITKWGREEIELAKEKTELYKSIRETVQLGTPYKLMSPYESNHSVLQYVSEDQSTSVVLCYNVADQLAGSSRFPVTDLRVKLRGLEPSALYSVEGMAEPFTGNYLMETGIRYPVKGIFKSAVIKITRK